MQATVDVRHKTLSLRNVTLYKICDVTSCGSHRRLLKRDIIHVQALGDRTNPSVLWLKSDVNMNKNGTFVIQLYLLYFLLSKMITAHF